MWGWAGCGLWRRGAAGGEVEEVGGDTAMREGRGVKEIGRMAMRVEVLLGKRGDDYVEG